MIIVILYIIIMIPLIFFCNYWIIFYLLSLITFFFLFKFSSNFLFINISYMLGIDLLRYLIILLRLWICLLIILARKKIYEISMNFNYFLIVNLVILIILVIVFSSINLFIFYFFFEFRLIPVLLIILGWGYQPERIQAGTYLLFYTLFASLPIIISIFYLYEKINSIDYFFIKYDYNYLNRIILYLFINFVFFIKIPIYFVHLWLPKAHVEAPIAGSMILAGIILKLGGYGLIRLIVLFIEIGIKINIYFIILSLIGGFFISLICMCQSDLKSLIAYSSVAHIGLVLSGILTLNYWGIRGALVIIVAHGLCSSGLFCLSNISYERLFSRRIYLNKGLLNIVPRLSLWWFLLCSSNMAAPPSINLIGEIILINRLVSWRRLSIIFLSLISFFRAVYSLYLYSYTQHGSLFIGIYSNIIRYLSEFKLLLIHWFPLNILVLKGEILFYMFYLSSLFKILVCGTKVIFLS